MTQLDFAARLAAALLLEHGEVSLTEIEALPFVSDWRAARLIVRTLQQRFDTELLQRRASDAVRVGYWEDIVRLTDRARSARLARRSVRRIADLLREVNEPVAGSAEPRVNMRASGRRIFA